MTTQPNSRTPAGRAMANAWKSIEKMNGYVPTRLLADQPPDIQRAWVAVVQGQTAEAKALGMVVEPTE